MDATSSPTASPKPRRRWFQFSLRTLLIFTLVVSVTTAWVVNKYNRHQAMLQLELTGAHLREGIVQPKGRKYASRLTEQSFPTWLFSSERSELITTIDLPPRTKFTDDKFHLLKEFPELESLTVRGADEGAFNQIANCASGIMNLSFLNTTIDSEGLEPLTKLKSLKKLHFQNVVFHERALQHIDQLQTLEELTFDRARISHGDVSLICRISNLKKLSGLPIETMDSLDDMRTICQLTQLREMSMQNIVVRPEHLELLAKLKRLKSIRFQRCVMPEYRNDFWQNFPELKEVYLNGSSFDDAWVTNLARELPDLNLLYAASTTITDASLDSILKLHRIKSLSLHNAELPENGVKRLSGMKGLEHLYLGARLPSETIQFLKTELPNCDVVSQR